MTQTLLGFDYGHRRIGVAVGETVTQTARALTTLSVPRSGEIPWPKIETLVSEWQPARVIVGLPRHLDGSESALAADARDFAVQIERRTGCPVTLWNEALSTEAARETVSAGRRAGRRRGGRDRVNAEAARTILEGWMSEGHIG